MLSTALAGVALGCARHPEDAEYNSSASKEIPAPRKGVPNFSPPPNIIKRDETAVTGKREVPHGEPTAR